MISQLLTKIRGEHFVAVIAAYFISSAILLFLLDPFAFVFEKAPITGTAFAFALDIIIVLALSHSYFHFSRNDAEGIASAFGLLGLWQISHSMLEIAIRLTKSVPEEYGIYMKMIAVLGSALMTLMYAGIMFVVFWNAFPKETQSKEKKR